MITGKMKVTDVVKSYQETVEIFNDFLIIAAAVKTLRRMP